VQDKFDLCLKNANISRMKVKREDEKLINFGFRLPPDLIEKLRESALSNRRSINNEMIVLLEMVFNPDKKWAIAIKDFEKVNAASGDTPPDTSP